MAALALNCSFPGPGQDRPLVEEEAHELLLECANLRVEEAGQLAQGLLVRDGGADLRRGTGGAH